VAAPLHPEELGPALRPGSGQALEIVVVDEIPFQCIAPGLSAHRTAGLKHWLAINNGHALVAGAQRALRGEGPTLAGRAGALSNASRCSQASGISLDAMWPVFQIVRQSDRSGARRLAALEEARIRQMIVS